MNLSAWAIRQPIPTILLFIILTVGGLVSFRMLKVQDFPDIELPAVTVTTVLPGATPTQLETEVTRKIEDSIASIGSIKHIRSTVTDGSSLTTIEFQLGKNVQEAVDDVRNAVSKVRNQLPSDVQDPVIARVTFSAGAILTYAIQADLVDEFDLSWYVDNTVAKSLLAAPGVAQVTRQGGVDREVRVELDPARMAALNVTAADVSRQLRSSQQEAPGGRGNIGNGEQAVRTISTVGSAAEIAAITVPIAVGRRVRLDEVATILDTNAERRQLALLDGKPVVAFQVFRSRGAGEVEVAKGVRAQLEKLAANGRGITFREIGSTVRRVQDQYSSSMNTLYEGAVLAVIVVWLFLRNWRATFVAAVALPLSIVPTFLFMNLLGYGLNTVSLLALTLVIGILVDDAIVEVENIVRHLRMGKPPLEAAIEAVKEIGLAVVATSLTLVAVFLPTAFMSGIPGQFFKNLGWPASIAVLASLLVARLLTPMMAAYILTTEKPETGDGPLMTRYLRVVRWCLAHPLRTAASAGGFFFASLLLLLVLPSTFIPPGDLGQTNITVEAPPGSTLEQSRALAEQARQLLSGTEGVATVYTAIGTGTIAGSGGGNNTAGEVRKATLTLKFIDKTERKLNQQQIEAIARRRLAALPGVRIAIGAGGSGEKLTLVLSGDDSRTLSETAGAVVRDIRTISGLGNVSSSASLLRPEIVIRPDAARAAELGVTTAAIGEAIRVATTGDYNVSLAKLNLPDRQVPIRVQIARQWRDDLEAIGQLRVAGSSGTVPISNVANIGISGGPAQIDRFDRSRNVTIDAELGGRPLGEINQALEKLPSLKALPAGVSRIAAGDAENQADLIASFVIAMVTGIFCVYGVLVLLFDDFMQPVTILAALPLSFGGAFGMLALVGDSLSLPVLIGLLMLMGIVTKNSILLVEYAILARRDLGLTRTEALVDACHKRARPILMTTVAMIAGMVPLALGLEGDASFRSPMAVAVIGGLVTSTVLSLLVIPVVFELVDDFKMKALGLWRRRTGKKGHSAPGNAA